MSFPDKKKIEKILPSLENSESTLALNSDATPLEKFRWEIQQRFVQYKHQQGITQKQLAERLGVDEAKVSKILHNRLDEFSTDRLVNLLSNILPDVELKVS